MKRENLDTQIHIQGRLPTHREKMTIYKQGEKPQKEPALPTP